MDIYNDVKIHGSTRLTVGGGGGNEDLVPFMWKSVWTGQMKDGDSFTPTQLGFLADGEYRMKILFTGAAAHGQYFEFSLNPDNMGPNFAITAYDNRFQHTTQNWVSRVACLYWDDTASRWNFRAIRPSDNNATDANVTVRNIDFKVFA